MTLWRGAPAARIMRSVPRPRTLLALPSEARAGAAPYAAVGEVLAELRRIRELLERLAVEPPRRAG